MTKPNEDGRDGQSAAQGSTAGDGPVADGSAGAAEGSEAEAALPKARYAADFDLTLESATYFWAGSATNLSKGGFFVATHILQEIGERFKFTIRLPESNQMIRGIGEVRWHRPMDESPEAPAGMGIQFVELDEGAQERIDDYLAQREPVRWDAS